ncbi:restriction endonuclease subunit S [Prevotella pectinovora]|uniref:restriction endonuclease subunit S n=1 Tax=Prevotella pectinovora TaxID=1602169 RepID=UPI002FDAD49B
MTINNEHNKLNVPNLRFKEFQGEWEKTKFGDIATGFDYGMNAAAKNYDGVNKYIRITDIDEASSTYTDKDIVSPDGVLTDNYLVNNRDILLARTGASTGKSYLYKKSDGKLYYAGFLIRANVTTHDPYFVFSQLHTHRYWRWVSIMSARSGQPGINSQEYSSFPIYTTSIEEERKIAKLLSLLDERIATQSKIIEDLKKLKCAIIEKHYRQAKLHKYKICDLGVPFSVGSLSKEDLSEEGHECILYGELFTTYDCVINEVKSHTNKIVNTTLSQKGDLLFPSSTTVDAVSLISPSVIDIPNVILGGDMFGIHIDKKFNAYYLSYYINLIARKKLAIYAKGSTIIHLHYKDIAKAQLLLPDLCEQDKIAKCMMAEDAKIKLEEQLLTKLEKQKQYLLRQMFI